MEVIAWLLHPKPEMRATVYDMERDPWVWQPINIEDYSWEQVLPNSGKNDFLCIDDLNLLFIV